MNTNVRDYLEKKGYKINDTALSIIDTCKLWYENITIEDFHKRKTVRNIPYTLQQMNFSKRLCADEAKLIEVVKINSGTSDKEIDEILSRNNFLKLFREQVESITALGSAACYVRVEDAEVMEDGSTEGGNIVINYVRADGYIPLTVVNGEVIEAAFHGDGTRQGKKATNLVIFTLVDGLYRAESTTFNDTGAEMTELRQVVTLGEVKPFAVLKNAEVNNIPNMFGYGLPRLYNSIPLLKIMDLCFNVLFGDLDLSDKMLLVNEMLCDFDDNGKIIKPNERAKRIFVPVGEEKLPKEKELIQEYNPEIRIDEVTKSFELTLSLISMSFGYGTKRYSFENGRIQTATEYAGERQDSLQELNLQRAEATEYIETIIRAVRWFLGSTTGIQHEDDEIVIEFDDSYITNAEAELEHMRTDALSFPQVSVFLERYIEKRLNLKEGEGKEYITTFDE